MCICVFDKDLCYIHFTMVCIVLVRTKTVALCMSMRRSFGLDRIHFTGGSSFHNITNCVRQTQTLSCVLLQHVCKGVAIPHPSILGCCIEIMLSRTCLFKAPPLNASGGEGRGSARQEAMRWHHESQIKHVRNVHADP